MKPKKLDDGIYYLPGAFFVFHVVVGSGACVLIELGISQLVPQVAHDLKAIEEASEPDILLALHGHFDHAGAAARWKKELPHAELCGSEAASDKMSNPEVMPPYLRAMQSVSKNPFFKDVYPLAEDDVFLEPVEFDSLVGEGTEIDLGGNVLNIINTPGHSNCSISAWNERTRTLFVSDACGMPMSSGRMWPTAFMDRVQYEQSIKRMMELKPEHLCFGHNPPISGETKLTRFFDRNLRALDTFFERIETLKAELGDKESILTALNEEFMQDALPGVAWVIKYGNKEMVRQVVDGVYGRG